MNLNHEISNIPNIINIKPLDLSDISAAAKVIRASFATVAKEFGINEQNLPNHTSFMTAEELRNHVSWGWLMYGLYDGARLIGYVSLSKTNDEIFVLHNLAVLPEYRHKGYGGQLLDFCKTKVKESGGSKITLGMIEENTVLKDWYTANGFIHTGMKWFRHMPFTVGFMEWDG